jgi:hypothetical protein
LNAFDYFVFYFIIKHDDSKQIEVQELQNELESTYNNGSTKNPSEIFQKYSNEIKTIREKAKNVFEVVSSTRNTVKIRFLESKLSQFILKSFGDEDKKNILMTTIDAAKNVAIIMEKNDLPQTTCYRKINELIKEGFFIITKYTTDNRQTRKYQSLFLNLQISIKKNEIILVGTIPKQIYEKSSFVKN